jgi:hypothetical protein
VERVHPTADARIGITEKRQASLLEEDIMIKYRDCNSSEDTGYPDYLTDSGDIRKFGPQGVN